MGVNEFSLSCLHYCHAANPPLWFFGWGRSSLFRGRLTFLYITNIEKPLKIPTVNSWTTESESSSLLGIFPTAAENGCPVNAWENPSPIGQHMLNSTYGQILPASYSWTQKEQQELQGTSSPRLYLKALWLTYRFSSYWNYWQSYPGWLEVVGWSFSEGRKGAYISSCLPSIPLAGY